MSTDNTTRFSNRVEDYVKYRPGYPDQVIPFLQREYKLTSDKVIADIGAGTGISTGLFLKEGYSVFAVEPNKEMRDKAVELLGNTKGFHAINGTAEHTGLELASVDAVVAGQAFHWFDAKAARAEFSRILKPRGLVVLIWNERRTETTFEEEYDWLIVKHGRDYVKVDHRNIDEEHLAAFFDPEPFAYELFHNKQIFDLKGLEGRLLSSSYMPGRGEEGYEELITELKELFERYQENGLITIHYDTKVYTGSL